MRQARCLRKSGFCILTPATKHKIELVFWIVSSKKVFGPKIPLPRLFSKQTSRLRRNGKGFVVISLSAKTTKGLLITCCSGKRVRFSNQNSARFGLLSRDRGNVIAVTRYYLTLSSLWLLTTNSLYLQSLDPLLL